MGKLVTVVSRMLTFFSLPLSKRHLTCKSNNSRWVERFSMWPLTFARTAQPTESGMEWFWTPTTNTLSGSQPGFCTGSKSLARKELMSLTSAQLSTIQRLNLVRNKKKEGLNKKLPGINPFDEDINVDWPIKDASAIVVSERDTQHPSFKSL